MVSSANASKITQDGILIPLFILMVFLVLSIEPGSAQEKAAPTQAEKQAAAAKADRFVNEQAQVINKVPGVHVTANDLKEEPKTKGPGLNPVAWLLRPVTRLQEQSVRLEQQIMKLTGPIASLQPSMLGLSRKMDEVRGDMKGTRDDMSSTRHEIVGVSGQISSMQKDLTVLRGQVARLEGPIRELKGPIDRLQGPLGKLETPLNTVGTRMNNLDRQLGELKMLISLVLTSIFVAAGLIAIGTPLAAILVWRNRQKLLPKPDRREQIEEAKLSKIAKNVDRGVHANV